LTGDDEPPAFLGAQVAFSRGADVRGDEAERLLAIERRQHAFAIVPHDQRRAATQAATLDGDAARARIDGVLHQLGNGLPRVGLRSGEPADQVERVCWAEKEGAGRGLRHR